MATLKKWLVENRFYRDNTGNTPLTVNIMTGGNLYVPDERYDEFLGLYGNAIERYDKFLGLYGNEIEAPTKKLTYSEKRSAPVFRMYFDLDMLGRAPMSDDAVLEIVKEVQKTTVLFFPGAPNESFKCVVSRTKDKEVEVSSKVPREESSPDVGGGGGNDSNPPKHKAQEVMRETFVKTGVHINFPMLLVNLSMALQLRFSLLSEMEKKFGQREIAHNPWSDVIDKAPYNGGLKMVGSVKKQECKECKTSKKKAPTTFEAKTARCKIMTDLVKLRKKCYARDDPHFDYGNFDTIGGEEYKNEDISNLHTQYQAIQEPCHLCGNTGWYLEDRTYSPSFVLGKGGVLCDDDLQYIAKDYHEQMRWTSIRARPCDEVTATFEIPRGHFAPPQEGASSCMSHFSSTGLEYLSNGMLREIKNGDISEADALGVRKWRGPIVTDDVTMQLVKQCIQGFHRGYSNVMVREVREFNKSVRVQTRNTPMKKMQDKFTKGNGAEEKGSVVWKAWKSIMVSVKGEGSKYCINKGCDHTSNTAYFSISEKGVVQMCHSKKKCDGFYSEPQAIDPALKRRLFTDDRAPIKQKAACGLKTSKDVKKPRKKSKLMWTLGGCV